jgi:cytoskeletal protein RodZ
MNRRTPTGADLSQPDPSLRSFDDFELRLGDTMRGERATMGKSLLDVQRELRIRASYIAAIENSDPSAFDTPGFIAGYVRSYARYLGMDPEQTFAQFCEESGFSVAHGMSERASSVRKSMAAPISARDPLVEPRIPFAARDDSILSHVQPGAIGSLLVLLALIGGIGYGGWSVLQEVQRVQVTPVDQTPLVFSELDPLQAAIAPSADPALEQDGVAGVFSPPSRDWYDRMQRPEALDRPVLVARDGPISTLDPDRGGAYAQFGVAPTLPPIDQASAPPLGVASVSVLAVRPAFVRITGTDGIAIYAGILDGGERFDLPAGAGAAQIEVGVPDAIYVAVDDMVYGPVGTDAAQSSVIALTPQAVAGQINPANIESEPGLAPMITAMQAERTIAIDSLADAVADAARMPQVVAAMPEGVTVVATEEAWVRVTAASGTIVFEAVMQPGDSYTVPPTETPPTIRAGNAGAVYFAVAGQTYGPYMGYDPARGSVQDGLALSADMVSAEMAVADLTSNTRLAQIVAELGEVAR